MFGVVIIGSGAWGTALSTRANGKVVLYSRDASHAAEMCALRENRKYLPNVKIPDSVEIITNIKDALSLVYKKCSQVLICIVVPSSSLRNAVIDLNQALLDLCITEANVFHACKGVTPEWLLPHEIIKIYINQSILKSFGMISGPSFSKEVADGLPVFLILSSNSKTSLRLAKNIFESDETIINVTDDVIGIEICSIVKNIIAIACGISDSLKLGENIRATIIALGFEELRIFSISLGAHQKAILNPACLGDLILTCTSNLSRNKKFGSLLVDKVLLSEMCNDTVEGRSGLEFVIDKSRKMKLYLPIVLFVKKIIFFEQKCDHHTIKLMLMNAVKQSSFLIHKKYKALF